MIQLRDYQIENAEKAANSLKTNKLAYLSMQVRTGKTLTALEAASIYGAKKVLIVTTKKAIGSIKSDYDLLNPDYSIELINYESLHKITEEYDLIIADEAHKLGAYPKPSLRAKQLKLIVKNSSVLFLSGTPSPESYSQLYHQFWVSPFSPFLEKNFYTWAKSYVDVKKVMRNGFMTNNYALAKKDLIESKTKHLFFSKTQEEAGFNTTITEKVLNVAMPDFIRIAIKTLKKDKIAVINDKEIVAETPAKLLTKLHQLSSGTIKDEEGNYHILSDIKAQTIKETFRGQKIAIFYIFQAEKEMLMKTFPNYTESPEEFQKSNDKVFLGQFVSAREGVRLDTADALIFFNLMHSYLSYEQARNRLMSKERIQSAPLYFVFSDCGIEKLIYKAVTGKKDFTLSYYKKYDHD